MFPKGFSDLFFSLGTVTLYVISCRLSIRITANKSANRLDVLHIIAKSEINISFILKYH